MVTLAKFFIVRRGDGLVREQWREEMVCVCAVRYQSSSCEVYGSKKLRLRMLEIFKSNSVSMLVRLKIL